VIKFQILLYFLRTGPRVLHFPLALGLAARPWLSQPFALGPLRTHGCFTSPLHSVWQPESGSGLFRSSMSKPRRVIMTHESQAVIMTLGSCGRFEPLYGKSQPEPGLAPIVQLQL
jgi:hypothetical protein